MAEAAAFDLLALIWRMSGISLSGLVQLPPKEGFELKVPPDESEESDVFEQEEDGRSRPHAEGAVRSGSDDLI